MNHIIFDYIVNDNYYHSKEWVIVLFWRPVEIVDLQRFTIFALLIN